MIAASFVSLFEVHLLHQNFIIRKSEKKKDKTKNLSISATVPSFICSLLVHFSQQQDMAAPHLCRLLSLAVALAGWYVYVTSRLHIVFLFFILDQRFTVGKFVWFSGNRSFAQCHVWRCYWRFSISVLMKLKPFMKFFPKQTITCYVSLLCFASFIGKMLVYWHWLELEVEESSKYQQDSWFSSLYLVC